MLKVMPEAAKGVVEAEFDGSDERRGAARKDEPTRVQRVADRNTGCSCASTNVALVARGGDDGIDVDAGAERFFLAGGTEEGMLNQYLLEFAQY
jgi:hypothetical protein